MVGRGVFFSARAGNLRQIVSPEQMEMVLEGSDSLHRRMAAFYYTLFSELGAVE